MESLSDDTKVKWDRGRTRYSATFPPQRVGLRRSTLMPELGLIAIDRFCRKWPLRTFISLFLIADALSLDR